jgi:hypothetical protein
MGMVEGRLTIRRALPAPLFSRDATPSPHL